MLAKCPRYLYPSPREHAGPADSSVLQEGLVESGLTENRGLTLNMIERSLK